MKHLAVIGNPVDHSRSPEIHTAFAAQARIQVSYVRIKAGIDAFEETARQFIAGGGMGFNVTVPFKREAFEMMASCSREATESQTVNTVTVHRDGSLHGDNTDGSGLVRDLTMNLGWTLTGGRILIVGAGGAVSGVLPALIASAPESVHIFNRTFERARGLQAQFDGKVTAVTEAGLDKEYDFIISGSSAGLAGGAQPDLPGQILGPETRCYDMIYSGHTTTFNQWAIDCGARHCSDGLGMLVEQAAVAFRLWFGFEPSTSPVISHLRHVLRGTD